MDVFRKFRVKHLEIIAFRHNSQPYSGRLLKVRVLYFFIKYERRINHPVL